MRARRRRLAATVHLLLACTLAAFAAPPAPKGFDFNAASGVSNRLITPNGDGLNDNVVFSFANPRDSEVSGRIYDVRGKLVASIGPTSGTTLVWDGKSGGRAVASGPYIYVLESEQSAFQGVVVVVK